MNVFNPRTFSTDWEVMVIDKLERCVSEEKLAAFAGVLQRDLDLPITTDWETLEFPLGINTSFDQLWDYWRPGWARRFFEQWKAALRWQRLKPYEKFARMVESHWDGIALYCQPENKVSLGFVEGLNNKIRVIQRRAYGLRDEEYLRLKILTCMLPAL